MPEAPKLDTRPARTDLTSRECAKLLGCLIGSITNVHHNAAAVRQIVTSLAEHGFDDVLAAMILVRDLGVAESDYESAGLLIAYVHSVASDMTAPGAMKTALQWWAYRDELWDQLLPAARMATAALMEQLAGKKGAPS